MSAVIWSGAFALYMVCTCLRSVDHAWTLFHPYLGLTAASLAIMVEAIAWTDGRMDRLQEEANERRRLGISKDEQTLLNEYRQATGAPGDGT